MAETRLQCAERLLKLVAAGPSYLGLDFTYSDEAPAVLAHDAYREWSRRKIMPLICDLVPELRPASATPKEPKET